MATAQLSERPYERFHPGTFVLALLAAAVLLLILPIGFLLHSEVILYAALLGTVAQFVAIYRMTIARLFE